MQKRFAPSDEKLAARIYCAFVIRLQLERGAKVGDQLKAFGKRGRRLREIAIDVVNSSTKNRGIDPSPGIFFCREPTDLVTIGEGIS